MPRLFVVPLLVVDESDLRTAHLSGLSCPSVPRPEIGIIFTATSSSSVSYSSMLLWVREGDTKTSRLPWDKELVLS
jgi:hypothetical protein